MVPAEEIERRLAAFRRALAEAGLDGALVVQSTDLAYLTGTNQQAHLIVPTDGEPRLLVRRTLERARAESPLAQIDPLGSLSGLPDALEEAELALGSQIGLELDVLPAQRYLGYAKRLDGWRLGDCSAALRATRAVKSEWELERMRRAAAQVDAAARAVPQLIGPGISEPQVQLEVERVLRQAGHQGQLRFRGFNQEMHYGQVLGGPSGAVPGYSDSPLCGPGPNAVLGKGPDGHVLADGDPVIVDLVGGHEGYLADQTRTFVVGRAADELRRAYDVAVEILREAEQSLRPGGVPAKIFDRSEQMAAEAGLGEHFMGHGAGRVRFLGHGVGLEIDELPILAPGFDDPLAPGHVVAVEPKFIFPGVGAVGIENMYAVTDEGCENITTAPEELIDVSVRHPLSEDQQLLVAAVRTLARERIAPMAADIDKRAEFPWPAVELLREHDVFALCFPEQHGGTGTGTLTFLRAVEELSWADATVGLILAVQSLGAAAIELAGSEQQKDRYLPRWASGEWISAYALTEAGSGSDARALRTTARRDGDQWVIDGGKRFITNAGVAHTYVVFARTGDDAISAFMVEADAPGFSVTRIEPKMGIKGSTTGELAFDGCRVPAGALVGEEGGGFRLAMRVLDRSRPGIAAQALGIAQAALDQALRYATERETFGKPIAQHQAIQFLLADMAVKVEASRGLLYDVGTMLDQGADGPDLTRAAAMAKLMCSDTAMAVTTDAVQILGGYGYIEEFPVERMMRDAKITQIYEGTNQIQRMVIARELLRDLP